MNKAWRVEKAIDQKVFDKFPEISPVVLQLLHNRGLTSQNLIDQFLSPDYGRDLVDPFLFGDMDKIVDRIFTAIKKNEKIIVYGDYDADGVTSSALMMTLLKGLGANVDIYIPYREKEGYGLNINAVTNLAAEGANLVVTVDCGTTNIEAIDFLAEKGVDVIVTDHHYSLARPEKVYAIINPNIEGDNYPFKSLTGCGMAFKVAQAIMIKQSSYGIKKLDEGFEKWLLDLVAIGTIADIQPLLGENRVLVKYGLIVMNQTKRIGLKKLISSLGNKSQVIDEKIVGWQIAPRLNAAGRLNHASTAYEILITQDESRAEELTNELTKTNQERQQVTDQIKNQAKKIIGDVDHQKLLVGVGDGWSIGIVGLVAGRITDQYHRPSMIISHFNDLIIGSARSIPEFNIIEAIGQCSDFLSKFGGHPQAAGFTVKDEKSLGNFIAKMKEIAEEKLQTKDIIPVIEIDAEVELEQIDWKLFEEIKKFEPFGQGNNKPKFLAKGVTVIEHKKIGKNEAHIKLMISHKTPVIRKTVGFSFGEWCDKLKRGDKIDIVFEVDVNEWNGNRELQLKIIDIKNE